MAGPGILCKGKAYMLHGPPTSCPVRARAPPFLQVTAMQIASLKKLSKGTTLYIIDRNGATAKAGKWLSSDHA